MADGGRPERLYVLHFAQSHLDFRLAEFQAAAEYIGAAYQLEPTPARGVASEHAVAGDVSRPFMLCRLTDDEAAVRLLQRCSCLRAVWELWATADTYAELHERNRATRHYARFIPAHYSWKALIQSFNISISDARRLRIINEFSYMAFQGPTRMRGADLTWGVLEEYARARQPASESGDDAAELGDQDPRLVQLFLARKIKDRSGVVPARDLIDKLNLKKRRYIGNTSMESEMSIVMANMALSGPSKLVHDPFAGTGSMLYACCMFGAYAFGSDIDGRMLRGKNAAPAGGQRATGVALSAEQYGLRGRVLDCATFDMTRAPWRSSAIDGMVDAIVTDPPYGVRAGAKRLGKRDTAQQRDEPFVMPDGRLAHQLPDYVPPTRPYRLSELVHDLLNYASALLKPRGRLVFWIPTMNEDNAETSIPSHPHFALVAHSLQDFGKWGRRLITLEKRTDTLHIPAPQRTTIDSEPTRARASDGELEFRNRVRPHPRQPRSPAAVRTTAQVAAIVT